ncbi:MAG: ABC transporter permease subunit [Kiritimatiellae bacterium]|nr:ABC transporter permease subunit [Kiritimatiellia bacterium]
MISRVGRKSWRARGLVAAMYGLLAAGAVAVLYPLALLAAGSTKSMADLKEHALVPRFLYDDGALWAKHLEALFNESVDAMGMAFDGEWATFEAVPLPEEGAGGGRVDDWDEFLRSGELPEESFALGWYWAPQGGAFPPELKGFREWLREKYGDLGSLNAAMGTDFDAWYGVFVQPPSLLFPYAREAGTPMAAAFAEYKAGAAGWHKTVLSVKGFWHRLYLRPRHGRDVAGLNAAWGTAFGSWAEVPLPATAEEAEAVGGVPAREDWEDFSGRALAERWSRAGEGGGRVLDTPDRRWNQWLRATGRVEEGAPDEPMPQREWAAREFRARKGEIRREFLWRNFRTVLDYVGVHGRGIANTAIYCSLAVLLALLVNPLAAYALSRGRLKRGTQILFFLMLTMAFPHMVTQIPVFVLLRRLGLLNTFAALLLPGMASGYSIFLLKGFFDSLPQELYESAQLDGAGEWTLFWQLTMRLSTPILSVIALQAFTVAYANFMYALLICQEPKMWTLMVWLYQLQQRSGPGVTQASLMLAAVPTLAVFLACQRVLLRGIVVPVEK